MSPQPQHYTADGLHLQHLAKQNKLDSFKIAFVVAIQHWAREFGFKRPTALTAVVQKRSLEEIGGGTPPQVQLLLSRINVELQGQTTHNIGPKMTLHEMAEYYFKNLRR